MFSVVAWRLPILFCCLGVEPVNTWSRLQSIELGCGEVRWVTCRMHCSRSFVCWIWTSISLTLLSIMPTLVHCARAAMILCVPLDHISPPNPKSQRPIVSVNTSRHITEWITKNYSLSFILQRQKQGLLYAFSYWRSEYMGSIARCPYDSTIFL